MWHWSGMLIQIISAISANYNCQCGGTEPWRKTWGNNLARVIPLHQRAAQLKEKQSAWAHTAPTHHFKNSLWWTRLIFFWGTSQPAALFFLPMCTHRPQSNYNSLGWNYSKNDHIFYSLSHREYGFWEIWAKLLLAENIIIYIYECVLFWFDKWFKMQCIVSN